MLYLKVTKDLSMGKKSVPIELKDGSTFGDLLKGLEQNFGSELAEEIYDSREQSLQVMVWATINGVLTHNLSDGLDTALHHGDTIIFLPLVMGG